MRLKNWRYANIIEQKRRNYGKKNFIGSYTSILIVRTAIYYMLLVKDVREILKIAKIELDMLQEERQANNLKSERISE